MHSNHIHPIAEADILTVFNIHPIAEADILTVFNIHPIAEADILTVFKLCAKTFVYSGNDDVFSTVTPS